MVISGHSRWLFKLVTGWESQESGRLLVWLATDIMDRLPQHVLRALLFLSNRKAIPALLNNLSYPHLPLLLNASPWRRHHLFSATTIKLELSSLTLVSLPVV